MTSRITPTPEQRSVIFRKAPHIFVFVFTNQLQLTKQVVSQQRCGLLSKPDADQIFEATRRPSTEAM